MQYFNTCMPKIVKCRLVCGEMIVRGLYDFEHVGTQHENNGEQKRREARLGCAHAHELFEGIDVKLKDGHDFPQSFADYDVNCQWNDGNIPLGVVLHSRHTKPEQTVRRKV